MTARAWLVILGLALAIVAGVAQWLRWEGESPRIEGPAEIVLGRGAASVEIRASDERSGLRSVVASLRHAGGDVVLEERALPGNRLVGGPRPREPETLALQLDPGALGLTEGQAFLVVEARDWSWAGLFQGNVAQLEIPVEVDLTAPRVAVRTGLTYVRRGGSAAAVYQLDETAERHGVAVGDAFFPGHPFPGAAEPGLHVAIFAVPRNAPAAPSIQVVAEDRAGNRTGAGWPTRLQEREFEEVRIDLPAAFMKGKVRELARQLDVPADDPVAAFQKINRDERAANERRIREVAGSGGSQRHWQGAFLQMRNSAVTSRFAEHRRYFHESQQISEAIHYGYDLASTSAAPVEAAAAGQVLFADELGIYGTCVILDHGLGLRSLYGHLSRLDVKPGDRVEKGATLGLSGATGLAGGDHLHFAILVGDTYVDPKEWWDPRWVREHVEVKLSR